MSEAIGGVLSFAVGVAISPVPIIAVVLMLVSARGSANGPAFVGGWVAGLAILGTGVLLASGGADAGERGEPAAWVAWLKLALGGAALVAGARQWRGGRGDDSTPGWMRRVDDFTPQRAFSVGAALAAVNPKNALLTVGAAASIAQTGISTGQQAIALGVFVLIATLSVAVPVVVHLVAGTRAARPLSDLRDWMTANNAAVTSVVLIVIGAKLVGDGIATL